MKIKYLSFTLLAIIMLNGCELERFPKGDIATPNFWKTQSDVELALMGCYTHITESEYNIYNDGFADNNFCQYSWESKAVIVSGGNISTNTDFGYNYEGIRRFNYFLDNVDKVTMDEKLKKQYKAEVRVLRAWYYFDMANRFGPIPLFKTSVTEKEEAAIAPTAEKDVIAFVINELKESAPDLTSTGVKSRIQKGAALSLLARIHLIYNQWNEAADIAKQIMGMGYELFQAEPTAAEIADDDYSQFVTFADENDKKTFYKGLKSYEQQFWEVNNSNSEVILNREFIAGSYNEMSGLMLPNYLGGWSSVTPTVELVNAYWTRDGKPFAPPSTQARATAYNSAYDANNYKPEYLDEFKNRDTRLYASILFPGAIWTPLLGKNKMFMWQKPGTTNTSKTGYNYRKRVDPNSGKDAWEKLNHYPVIRYAEILLTYAEAKNEATGPDASVYDALDLIRTRAGMPKIDRIANANKEALRETIRNERRIELANEGLRWIDTRRWNISKDVMKNTYNINGGLVQERKWDEKFNRLPYPQKAVDRNPNLKEAQTAKGY